jgi:hypothetical protein
MPLRPTGHTDNSFAEALKKNLDAATAAKNDAFVKAVKAELAATAAKDTEKTHEEKLEEHRDDKGHEPATEPQEKQLDKEPIANRKDEPKEETMEGQLRKHEHKHAPNMKAEGTIEQRLNEASHELFPHRNEKAWDRTGDKRPINALPEEMGKASDDDKNKRYEKSSKSAFNMRRQKVASMVKQCPGYLDYKSAVESENSDVKLAAKATFAAVRDMDEAMTEIMKTASSENRHLTVDEKAQIAAIKLHKTELLKGGR